MVSSLRELIEEPEIVGADDPEERFISSGVSWYNYEALLTKLQENSHYRITYLDGILEIVSPSIRHENIKKRLAILLERYLYKKRIKFKPMGSSTIRKPLKQAGAEPDECYCIGDSKPIPDLAIEVNITSGSVDKLEIYRRLGVVEVWFWENNKLKLYHKREDIPSEFLDSNGYEQVNASELLPDLNISLLEECTLISDDILAIDEFEQGISS
jgi:Uma2 family endonuclease